MSVSSKWVREALVYYQEGNEARWLDAIGSNVVKWELRPGEPTNATDSLYNFVTTVTEAGAGETVMVPAQVGGKLVKIYTDAAEYDGVNAQLQGESFKLTAGLPLYFGAKIDIDDATQSDLLVGICELNTAMLATAAAHAIGGANVEGLFFVKIDGGTTIMAKAYKDNAQTATANVSTALDTSAHVYEIYWDGATAYFYFDGVLVTSVTSGFPDGDLTVTINVRAGSAANRTAYIHWMKCIQVL